MNGRKGRWGLGGLALATVFLLTPNPVHAQEGRVLTLDEALSLARENSPDYQMAVNDLGLNRSSRLAALGAFLPSLDFSTRTSLSFDRQLISTDFFGNPVENPVTEWLTRSSSSQYIGLSLPLFQGGSRFKQLSAQGASARVREAAASGRLRSVRAEVVRAYSQAQARQALLRVEEGLLDARQADLELTRRMYDLAGATRVEVLAAELSVQQQEQTIQQRLSMLQQGLLTLARIIGDPELEDFHLASEAPTPFDPSGLDADVLVERALTSSPLIQQRMAELDRGRAQVGVARGSRWPTVSLSLSFNQQVFAEKQAALFDVFPDQGRYGSAGLSLSVPLFSRFQTSAQISEAQVALDNADENLRKTRLQITEEAKSRLIALQTAYQGYRIALRSQEIAQERLGLARDQFRQGARSFTELQQDINASANAEREVINQLFGWVDALANLEETVGDLGSGQGG